MPVEARGMLRLEPPVGRPLELIAQGSQLRLELPAFREALGLFPHAARFRGRPLRLFAAALSTHRLTLTLESAGRPVFQLGHDVSPSWLARWLGLAPARIPLSSMRWVLRGDGSRK